MKNVLLVCYSQSGQLSSVAESVVAPLRDADDVTLHVETLKPKASYPYPWPFFRFFEIFPECVYMDGPEMEPTSIPDDAEFDLIILAYQTWFLSPALPITGFLQTDEAVRLIKDTPVMTLIACRNMWLLGQEKIKERIKDLGGKLIDNVVLTDQGNSLATFVTTPRWMFTGNKAPFLGFPPAGVAQSEVDNAKRFGDAIINGLKDGRETRLESLCAGYGAVQVDHKLILSENMAHRSFKIWGKLIRRIGPQGTLRRRVALVCYLTFLVTFILTVVPITMLLKVILRPLFKRKLNAMTTYYEEPSTRATDKL
jgi:hypothetical protein